MIYKMSKTDQHQIDIQCTGCGTRISSKTGLLLTILELQLGLERELELVLGSSVTILCIDIEVAFFADIASTSKS